MINKILKLNIKTIVFNLKYLPFRKAILFPFLIYKKVVLKSMKGKVIIDGKCYFWMIKIGYDDVSIFDKKYSRTIWNNLGKVVFYGNASLGHGSKISVGQKGVLYIGKNLKITAETSIVCYEEIFIGDDCVFSWNILIMDTDFHNIKDSNGIVLNPNMRIKIGNAVWIGCRSLITRGAVIPNNCVITANSKITHILKGENSIFGGEPVRNIKSNITWEK